MSSVRIGSSNEFRPIRIMFRSHNKIGAFSITLQNYQKEIISAKKSGNSFFSIIQFPKKIRINKFSLARIGTSSDKKLKVRSVIRVKNVDRLQTLVTPTNIARVY